MALRLTMAICLLMSLPALAEEMPPPNIQAMYQTIGKLTNEAINWQAQAIALKAENDELKKQLSDAQKPPKQ